VRRVALEHAVADLALRILDQQPALRALEEDDAAMTTTASSMTRGSEPVDSAPVRPSSSVPDHARQTGDDAGEDDQRDAVADAARGDLLAEPHQEHGAAVSVMTVEMRKNQPGSDTMPRRSPGRRRCRRPATRQQHRAVARVLVDDLAALLAFLLQRSSVGTTDVISCMMIEAEM
jgi:hypothetical protein